MKNEERIAEIKLSQRDLAREIKELRAELEKKEARAERLEDELASPV